MNECPVNHCMFNNDGYCKFKGDKLIEKIGGLNDKYRCDYYMSEYEYKKMERIQIKLKEIEND